MRSAGVRHIVAVTDGQHNATRPAEVELDDGVGGVAGGSPTLWCRMFAECGGDGVDEAVGRLSDITELRARAAAAVRGVQIRHANHSSAPAASAQMRFACRFRADRAVRRLAGSISGVIDVTDLAVRAADIFTRLVAEHHCMLAAVERAVLDARMRVSVARSSATRRAHPDFVGREYGAWVERAFVAMLFAGETPRSIGAAKVRRAVDGLIDRARRAMMFADGLRARRAARHLVDADVLGPATFAFRHALRAEPPLSVRR